MNLVRSGVRRDDRGFTLVELLVVMIIIGVLAAIAIPVFLTQRAKARDAATKADVSTVGKEITSYYVDGTAPVGVTISGRTATIATTSATPTTISTVTTSSGTVVNNVRGNDAGTWCVSFSNPDGSPGDVKIWRFSATGGLANGPCP